MMKINNFRGVLTDNSAKNEALPTAQLVALQVTKTCKTFKVGSTSTPCAMRFELQGDSAHVVIKVLKTTVKGQECVGEAILDVLYLPCGETAFWAVDKNGGVLAKRWNASQGPWKVCTLNTSEAFFKIIFFLVEISILYIYLLILKINNVWGYLSDISAETVKSPMQTFSFSSPHTP